MAIDVSAEPVKVTDRAASRIRAILAGEPAGTKLRVSVAGGGCSGYRYDFGFEQAVAEDDHVIQKSDVTVLIDSISLPLLAGSEIDFVDDLVGASFQVRNPNATSSCGCGTSFSV